MNEQNMELIGKLYPLGEGVCTWEVIVCPHCSSKFGAYIEAQSNTPKACTCRHCGEHSVVETVVYIQKSVVRLQRII